VNERVWTPPTEWERNVLAIEPSKTIIEEPDGRRRALSQVALSEEWMRQIFQGYRCIRCFQEFKEVGQPSWPGRCKVCGLNVKRDQRREIVEFFKGEHPVGPQDSLVDREEEFLRRRFHEPKVQIVKEDRG